MLLRPIDIDRAGKSVILFISEKNIFNDKEM